MEHLDIWYICDNEHATTVARAMIEMGFPVHVLGQKEMTGAQIPMNTSNLFIYDLEKIKPAELMAVIRSDSRVQNYLKFVVLEEDLIEQAISAYPEALHLEFISRPVNRREFILLVEKSMIVERYRELLKKYSREAENQIEEYESLLHIHKKDLFASEAEKNAFEKIIRHERNLLVEQQSLNKAIKDFTYLRQKDLFEMKNLLQAEEMLDTLRQRELLDANDVIKAQQNVLEFSNRELGELNRIIEATERTVELSREEALRLHNELKTMRDRNKALEEENRILKSKLDECSKNA